MQKVAGLVFLVLLVLCLTCLIYADEPVYVRLVIPVFFEAEIPKDIDLVQREVTRITKTKIGASVQLVPLLYLFSQSDPDPLRLAELDMLAKQGVNLDIFPSMVKNIEPIVLDDLLEQYGQEILALIGEFRISYARSNGSIYMLDPMNDYVSSVGISMRKDIIEKYDIDLSGISELRDLDEIYEYISRQEPDLKMISPHQTRGGFLTRPKHLMAVPSSILYVSEDNPSRLVNYYATDTYRQTVELLREWFEAGYMPENMAFQSIISSQLVNAGELFSYYSAYKPGIEFEESKNSGIPMVTIPLMEPTITKQSLNMNKWCISSSCVNPGKVMQFLNLLYTDSELVNLLVYGIEDLHYIVLEDGTIDYPEGVTAETVGYRNTLSWLLPNQMLSYIWTGNDPLLWEHLRLHNESAKISDTLYFIFDDSNVALEHQKIKEIIGKYSYGLETGQINPEIYLPKMLAEMEEAGADRVLMEGQAQYDIFLEREASK